MIIVRLVDMLVYMPNANSAAVVPVVSGGLGADEVVCLQEPDSRRLWEFAQQLASGDQIERLDAGQLAELGTVAASALPEAVLRSVHRFRNQGSEHDVLLLRGILPASYGLGPTPGTAVSPRQGAANLCAVCLVAVMNMFGEPFTFSDLYEGRMVQDVVAAPGKEDAQTSEGSDCFLEWHVEDAFSSDRCDYLGLLCLRGDPVAETILASARALVLPDEVRNVLAQPRYVILPDVAHCETPEPRASVPVLSGTREAPEIRFDSVYMAPADPADDEARRALECLTEAVNAAAVSHVLEPGDLLVVDNRRVAHARSPFPPRFDGSGRWLLRVMVCSSLERHRRRGSRRAI
jgi:L-asparagine oxygenase